MTNKKQKIEQRKTEEEKLQKYKKTNVVKKRKTVDTSHDCRQQTVRRICV